MTIETSQNFTRKPFEAYHHGFAITYFPCKRFAIEFEVWRILTYFLFIVVDVTLWKSFFESKVKWVVVPSYYSIAGQHVFCGHAKREGPYSSYARKMWVNQP